MPFQLSIESVAPKLYPGLLKKGEPSASLYLSLETIMDSIRDSNPGALFEMNLLLQARSDVIVSTELD